MIICGKNQMPCSSINCNQYCAIIVAMHPKLENDVMGNCKHFTQKDCLHKFCATKDKCAVESVIANQLPFYCNRVGCKDSNLCREFGSCLVYAVKGSEISKSKWTQTVTDLFKINNVEIIKEMLANRGERQENDTEIGVPHTPYHQRLKLIVEVLSRELGGSRDKYKQVAEKLIVMQSKSFNEGVYSNQFIKHFLYRKIKLPYSKELKRLKKYYGYEK